MTRTRTTLASALAGVLVWAAPAAAQQAQTQQQSGETSRTQSQAGRDSEQRGGQLSEDLGKSLQKLHAANQAEIELGNTAQQQAQSEDVKQFARTMVQEHEKADQKLQQTAQQFGVQLRGEEFQDAMKDSREKAQELQQKRGAEFDRAYMEHMVKDHREDVKNVHDAAIEASENAREELAQVLGETEATLHQHHAKAQQIQQQLERQARAESGQSQSGRTGAIATQSQPSDQQAQSGSMQQSGSQQQSGQRAAKSVVGTIQSVEGDKLSLKNDIGETNEFSIDDNTRFTRDGKAISKDEISEGDQVRASFTGDEGTFQATEVTLMTAGGQSSSSGDKQSGSSEQQQRGSSEQQSGSR